MIHFKIGGISAVLGLLAQFWVISAAAVVNGLPAPDEKFAAVGSLVIGTVPGVSCTATVIAARWIITADHCTYATEEGEEEGGGEPLPPSAYEFRLGENSARPVFRVKVKRWVHGPLLDEENQELADVAFGELSEPVPLERLRITPSPLLSKSWEPTDFLKTYLHIGYGRQEPFATEPTALTDRRQKADFTVTSAGGNALRNIFGDDRGVESYMRTYQTDIDLEMEGFETILAHAELRPGYTVHAWDARGRTDLRYIQMPAGGWRDTCFGDSGGPLFEEKEGVLRVVGVVSGGLNGTCATLGTRFTVFGPKVRALIEQLGL